MIMLPAKIFQANAARRPVKLRLRVKKGNVDETGEIKEEDLNEA